MYMRKYITTTCASVNATGGTMNNQIESDDVTPSTSEVTGSDNQIESDDVTPSTSEVTVSDNQIESEDTASEEVSDSTL